MKLSKYDITSAQYCRNAFLLLCMVVLVVSCQKEPLNVEDFKSAAERETNSVTLNEASSILTEEEKSQILEIRDLGMLVSEAFGNQYEVGDIIVNDASSPNDTLAFFRRITTKRNGNRGVILETENVSLEEAFDSYYLNSQFNSIEIKARQALQFAINKDVNGFSTTLAAVIDPMVSMTYNYDEDNSLFLTSYNNDETDSSDPRIEIRIKDFNIVYSQSLSIGGKVEGKIEGDFQPIVITTFPQSGMAIYFVPKLEIGGGLDGSIQTPSLNTSLGDYNIDFLYEEGEIKEASFIKVPPQTELITGDWEVDGNAAFEVKMGGEFVIAPIGAVELAKAGVFIFGYNEYGLAHRGDFKDLSPRLSLTSEFGLGAKFFLELNLFGGGEPPVNWVPDQLVVESEDFKTKFVEYDKFELALCNPYTSLDLDYQNSDLIFSAVHPFIAGSSLQFNEIALEGGAILPHSQSHEIEIPPSDKLVNILRVTGALNESCYLEDVVLDPSLVADCNEDPLMDADGNEYCFTQIGDLLVMTENYRYNGPNNDLGVVYNNEIDGQELIYGRLYTYEEIMDGYDYVNGSDLNVQGICPFGWHIPSAAEWAFIIQILGEEGFGKNAKLPSEVVWPSTILPDASVLNIVPAGEYYPWRTTNQFGGRDDRTHIWSATYFRDQKAVGSLFIDKSENGQVAREAEAGAAFENRSITNIGYSCRCVKNI